MIKTFFLPLGLQNEKTKKIDWQQEKKMDQTTGEVKVNIKKGNGSDKNRRGQGSDKKKPNGSDNRRDKIRQKQRQGSQGSDNI